MKAARALGPLAVVASSALLGGCSGFDRLDFQYKSAPPDAAVVTYDAIHIHEGVAVGVIARPMDGKDVMDDDTTVELESRALTVLGVGPALPDDPNDTSKANWNFVFYGVGVGTADVVVRVNGETQATIPATVDAQ